MSRAPVAAIYPGHVTDGSFMQQGHDGAREACLAQGLDFRVTERVPLDGLEAAMTRAAQAGAGLILAQGGQCDAAAAAVAPRFPAVRFVVVQGHRGGGNLQAWRAAQEQSAFLAGAAAALMAPGRVVGHVSGIRPKPGLLARAAFAAGMARVDPACRLLSVFTGDQDDEARAEAAAERLIDAGAGLVFAMLNGAQHGVMRVARRRGIGLVGDGRDWAADHPGLFRLAAIADTGGVAAAAIADHAAGGLRHGAEIVFGLETPAIVRLSCGAEVPAAVREAVEALARDIRAGRLVVPETAAVEELALPA